MLLVCHIKTILVLSLVCLGLSLNALSEKKGAQIRILLNSSGSPILLFQPQSLKVV